MTLEKILQDYGFEILGNKSIFTKEVSTEHFLEYKTMLERLRGTIADRGRKELSGRTMG